MVQKRPPPKIANWINICQSRIRYAIDMGIETSSIPLHEIVKVIEGDDNVAGNYGAIILERLYQELDIRNLIEGQRNVKPTSHSSPPGRNCSP